MTDSTHPRLLADRRALLRGMSVVAAAGGLAACGSDSKEDTSTSASTPAAGASSEASTGGSGGDAGGGVSVAKSKVPVGGGFIDKDNKFVVSQPTSGTYKAFTNICTHQQCAMTRIDGKDIVCSCHGSAFSLADGSVQNGPADKPLAAKTVTESGDNLQVS